MYTIFKNDCVFYITDNKEFSIKPNFFYWDKFHFQDNLIKCDSSVALTFYLYHSDIEFLWQEFKNKFKVIEAAGGVVFNKNNEILFIYRLDKWDLPKGKVEKGESIQETAIREVQEECGINKVIIDSFIGKTYHIYTYKEKEILKISYWYKMYSNENELIPQLEEDITKVVWKNSDQISNVLKNTYPNIELLLKKVILKIS
jgi:8-oxo-dGTP pyrophosphatase MutT (NUDIX family)